MAEQKKSILADAVASRSPLNTAYMRQDNAFQALKFDINTNDLIGSYRRSALICLCLCDASEGGYDITLPPAQQCRGTIFCYKKNNTRRRLQQNYN